jgi:lipoprotein signal peptidase
MIVASPTSTSTSIPTVELALTGVLTAGMVLIQTQGSAWSITGDQASMWWSLAMMVFVSAIILLLRNQFMQ